jgi:cation diffusion facilitator CzcD-associated flavoprotein CzcO
MQPTPKLDADILIAGAGFSGIGMGIALKKAGIESFLVLERASDVGGTWRENIYPGCACDIPSMLYSFSFERNDDWTRLFPPQEEIWDYLRRCSVKYGVQPHIRFETELQDARYDEGTGTWAVRTQHGTLRSRVLVSAMGPLDKPNVPEIAGLERFAGATFHSSRWDRGFDLRGKNVAVIGTGASSIQFVPQIAPIVRQLTLFQRTPPWIVPKPDAPVSPLQRMLRRFPPYAWAVRTFIYWFLEVRAYGFTVDPKLLGFFEQTALRHLERQVPDPVLRAKLMPDYRMGCKRVLLADDYYPTLQRENVELVTTPIRELREGAIVTEDGAVRPIDALIFGTGFRATDAIAPVKMYGRGGVELGEAWQRGAEAYLGISVAGFPNLYFLIGPNTGLGHNSMILMIEAQIRYVMSALEYMRRKQVAVLAVRADVQRDFNERLQEQMKHTVWLTGCKSWYLDKDGRNTTLWPSFTFAYRFLTRRLRPERYETTRVAT